MEVARDKVHEAAKQAVEHLRKGEIAAALELLPDFVHPYVITAYEISRLKDHDLLCTLVLAGDINPEFRERLMHVFPRVFGNVVTGSKSKGQMFEMVLSLCMALILVDKIEAEPSSLPVIGLKREIDKLKTACLEVINAETLREVCEDA